RDWSSDVCSSDLKSSFDRNSPCSRAFTIFNAAFVPNPSTALNGGIKLSPSTIKSVALERYKSTFWNEKPRIHISYATSSTVIKLLSFGGASFPFSLLSEIRFLNAAGQRTIVYNSKSAGRIEKYAA